MGYRWPEIKQFSPTSRQIAAVYVNDDGTLFRAPVVGFAVYDSIRFDDGDEEISRDKGLLAYVEFDEWDDGLEVSLTVDDTSNRLGYEIDGKENDWSKRIEEYFERQRKKQAKKG